MKIAKIVGSSSHIAYIARVLDDRDGETSPGPDDYGFGRFVSIDLEDETIVGVICDSRLVNPEYSNYAARIGPTSALGELKRDLMEDQKALVAILLLGRIKNGRPEQQIPHRVVPAGQMVSTMDANAVAAFHKGSDGTLQMHYFPNLMSQSGPLAIPLAKTMIEQLTQHCSDSDRQRLAVMSGSLSWKHTFGDTRF
jgi:hypothetical protein